MRGKSRYRYAIRPHQRRQVCGFGGDDERLLE